MATLVSSLFLPTKPPQNPNPRPKVHCCASLSKRELILGSFALCVSSPLIIQTPFALADAETETKKKKSLFDEIVNTSSWFRFFGDGFAIRVPPTFENLIGPEDFNAGSSFYGDRVKPKPFAAQFASPDGSEVVSVVIKPSNQLKITFLEAQDVTNLGSLKDAAGIFVPGGSTIYTARTIKIKEDEGFRYYYFYEFVRNTQHVALVAAVNRGNTIVAAATAPESMWDDDGVKLRSAAISLTVL
ncbi:hypothetical protein Droror1_Dr00023067 [Drosera rotundifolia]